MSIFVETAKNEVAATQTPMCANVLCSFAGYAVCASFLVILALVRKVHLYFFESQGSTVKLSLQAKTQVLRETFNCVMETDASSTLLVQTKSLTVDRFFKGTMLGRPFIMHGKSASESVRLLTHVRQLASGGHMQHNLQTQLQRCDGSVIDVELVAEWVPPIEESGHAGNFLFGLRLCRSTGDADTTSSPENETLRLLDAVDFKSHDENAGTDAHTGSHEASSVEGETDSKNKARVSRKSIVSNKSMVLIMPTIEETEEEEEHVSGY